MDAIDGENWAVPEEQKPCLGDVPGNEINGLGEQSFRRPKIIYWANRGDPLGPTNRFLSGTRGATRACGARDIH